MLESTPLAHTSVQQGTASREALKLDDRRALPHFGPLVVVLVVFALVTCLGGLGSGPSMGDHECINAQAARQILQSGNWLIPQLGEIPRVRKMPLGIWLIAASSRLVDGPMAGLPVTDLSARLPSALAGLATTLVVFWLGSMMYGRRGGLVAGFLWAGSAAAILFTRNALVDMVLTLFTALSFALFWRGAVQTPRSKLAMIGFYVAFALAMMAKAPLPLLTVGMALALFWLVALPLVSAAEGSPVSGSTFGSRAFGHLWERIKGIFSLAIIPGIPLWLLIVAAWPLYVLKHYGNALLLWKMEYFDMATGGIDQRPQPSFYYYMPIVFVFMGAYLLSVPEGLAAPFLRRYRQQRVGLAFAFTWGVWGLIALSMISTKRWHYPLSIMPAFCLLVAPVIERLFFGLTDREALPRIRLACRLLPLVLLGGLVTIGVFLNRGYSSILPGYAAIGFVVWVLLTAACLWFERGQRTLSFAVLNLAVAVLACLAWPLAGQHLRSEPDADEIAEKLKAAGVGTDAAIYIADSRPNSAIEFYHSYRVQRVFNELEMTKLRPSRKQVSLELMKIMANAVQKKLSEPTPVYILMKSKNYQLFKANCKVPVRVLFEVGMGKKPVERQVMITQGGTGTQAAHF